VSESFATGVVTGSSNVGGLVASGGSVNGSYWDIQATGQSQSAGGTGLNTSQMQGASAAQNMGALDFTNTWRVVTNPPGYPELRRLPDGSDPEPPLTAGFTITPEDPIVGEQLTFDADPSTPESDIESYDWTLGDGTTATGKQVTHTYTDSGQFTVELTVQNSTETDTATETVSVSPPSSFEVSDLTAPAQATPGTTIDVNATITNTGGAAGTQAVAFVFDGTTVANTTVELNASESTSVAFSPTVPDSPGTYEHGVFTDDDNKTAQITVGESGPPNVMLSSLSIAGQGDNATVTAGSYDVSVELSHDGGPNRTVPMELTIGNATTTETVSLNASESKTVTFENATGGLSPAVYNVTVSAVDASLTGELTLSVPVGDEPDPASDTDDDGLLEDTDGSGEFTIFDVQTFFVEFQSDPVQTNSALFNFDESGDGAVTIFDVQALFLELAG
jgi:PKD repeat protein